MSLPRNHWTLHEAMRTILLDHPERSATLKALSDENARRDLYRRKDGQHPEAFQFRLRAGRYPQSFQFLAPDKVRYVAEG